MNCYYYETAFARSVLYFFIREHTQGIMHEYCCCQVGLRSDVEISTDIANGPFCLRMTINLHLKCSVLLYMGNRTVVTYYVRH